MQVTRYGDHFSRTYGINRNSILSGSVFYHVVGGLPPDVMHDILEGVLHYEIEEICLKLFYQSRALLHIESLEW